MGVNRFYNPSLPQYTSQFVEDQTPWDQIMDLEQTKIQRSDKALEYAAETDALTKSLIPGYRTQDISPVVTENYKKRMDKWMQDYGESSYSVPALRELTKINAEFRADPMVKLIQQDREATPLYEGMKKSPNYRPETDPNLIDPATGQLRQFSATDQYRPYDQPIEYASYEDEMNEELRMLDKETTTGDPYTKYMDGPIGPNGRPTQVPLWGTDRITQINPNQLSAAEEQLVNKYMGKNTPASRYLAAKMGDDYNEENVRKLVKEQSTKFANKSVLKEFSAFPAGYLPQGKKGVPTPPKQEPKFSGPTPYTSASGVAPSTGVSLAAPRSDGSGPGKVEKGLDNHLIKSMYKATGGPSAEGKNGEIYMKYRDDMNVLVNDMNNIDGIGLLKVGEDRGSGLMVTGPFSGPGSMAQTILQRRLFEDPVGTMSLFNAYSEQKLNQFQSQGPTTEGLDVLKNIKKTKDYLNKELEKQGITEDAFESDLAFDQAKHAVVQSGLLAMPGSPFKSREDLYAADMSTMTPWQNRWLRSTMKKVERDQSKTVGFGKWESLPDDDLKKLNSLYFGMTQKSDGTFSTNKGYTAQFMGARIIDPEDPNDELTQKEKQKIFTEKNPGFIDGRLTDQSSQFGPGTLIINAGGKTYYMTGPDELVEPNRFENAVYSKDFSNRHGQGDAFAIQGVDPESFNMGIVDRWTKGKKPKYEADTWMAYRDNVNTGNTEQIVYKGDPESNKKYNEPESKENPNGYKTYPIGRTEDVKMNNITPVDFRYRSMERHIIEAGIKEAKRIKTLYESDPEKLQAEMKRMVELANAKLSKLDDYYSALKNEEQYYSQYDDEDSEDPNSSQQ